MSSPKTQNCIYKSIFTGTRPMPQAQARARLPTKPSWELRGFKDPRSRAET